MENICINARLVPSEPFLIVHVEGKSCLHVPRSAYVSGKEKGRSKSSGLEFFGLQGNPG